MESNRGIWGDLLFMAKLSTVCACLLLATKSAVGEKAELSVKTADVILQMFNEASLPYEKIAIERFNSIFARQQSGKIKLWRNVDNPDIWACEATGNGMWGEITVVFAINSATWKIIGLRVVEQIETVGLGARISEDEFGDKFVGLNASNEIKCVAIKIMNNEFDAVSGASVSSGAVAKIVNKALKAIRQKL